MFQTAQGGFYTKPPSPVGPIRTYAYGYRVNEVPLDPLPEIKEGCKIVRKDYETVDLERRPPIAVSTGPHLHGAAWPHGDPQDPATLEAGVNKRVFVKLPRAQRRLMAKLGKFVEKWLRDNLKPLPFDSDTSFRTWIEGAPYSRARKDELIKKYDELGGYSSLTKKFWNTKGFMKDEPYPEWKYVRSINSRTDEFKCIVGPIFKLIEKELFSLPYFIKKVPVADRPKYINDLLARVGAKYVATDYTAFESSFVKTLMETVEMKLYRYMSAELLGGKEWYDLIHEALTGENKMYFKHFKAVVPATRMSGEMNTSLGNSFTNLMIMLFMCQEFGVRDVSGVVEGDDGLFVGTGVFPTKKDFEALGLNLKMEIFDTLSEASFCGLIFDENEMQNISDPRKLLANFGWATGQYARASDKTLKTLLRAKSMSYLAQYPAAPIISELARYGMRMTKGYDVRRLLDNGQLGMWKRQILEEALKYRDAEIPIGPGTRDLMFRKFGISVEEQLRIEEILRNKNDLEPLMFFDDVPKIWTGKARN